LREAGARDGKRVIIAKTVGCLQRVEQLVEQGKVTEVAVGQENMPSGKSAFITARVDPVLAEKLEAKGVSVTGIPSGGMFQTILSWVPSGIWLESGVAQSPTS